jgi:hypothetical protein
VGGAVVGTLAVTFGEQVTEIDVQETGLLIRATGNDLGLVQGSGGVRCAHPARRGRETWPDSGDERQHD